MYLAGSLALAFLHHRYFLINMPFQNHPNGTRAKAHQVISGQPAAPQANGTRARAHQVISGHAPQQRPNGTRAKAAQVSGNPAFGQLGKTRAFPNRVAGAQELVGQVLEMADGRKFHVTGLDVFLPETDQTHAIQRHFGVAADATAVAHPPMFVANRPPMPINRTLPSMSWQPQAPMTIIRPADPPYCPAPFDHNTYVGKPIDQIGKHWNGIGAVLEGHGLTHASKNKINNAFFQGTQQLNRVAGRQLLPPPKVASGAATVARAMTNSRVAQFSSKFGGKITGVGAALSGSKIAYELSTDNYNVHTAIDGGMLIVTLVGIGVAASSVAAGVTAPVWVPIAGGVIMVYGILDYAFDVNDRIDQVIGREDKKKK
jgi:hypothetical protein